ncbi:hypothetical protein ACIA8F_02475 [Streptomyces sp. NPDC051563]|uniref:hypothetical protein n=1 Tax=Streptomyces sp. NPDC051563 TaxID=3365659 RepID=UPI0037A066B1
MFPAAGRGAGKGAGDGAKSDGADKRSVMIGDVIWTRLDKPVKGKSWMKMNLAADGKPVARRGEDPAEYLGMLLGQDTVRHVGAEQVGGTDAEHYKAILTGPELLKADEATKVMDEKEPPGPPRGAQGRQGAPRRPVDRQGRVPRPLRVHGGGGRERSAPDGGGVLSLRHGSCRC